MNDCSEDLRVYKLAEEMAIFIKVCYVWLVLECAFVLIVRGAHDASVQREHGNKKFAKGDFSAAATHYTTALIWTDFRVDGDVLYRYGIEIPLMMLM